MTQDEFTYNVDQLFKDYKIKTIHLNHPNEYWLTETKWIEINSFYKIYSIKEIFLGDVYHSPKQLSYLPTYEGYFDELIIFKELILPKYL